MTKNDGGTAFACAAENGHQPGMSLRDYFAGQALAGMLAYSALPDETSKCSAEDFAAAAYHQADAMIQERGRE